MIALSSLRTASLVMSDGAARFSRGAAAQPAAAAAIVQVDAGLAGPSSAAVGLDASRSVFDPARVDVTKLKIDLMEKVGKAFGYEIEDFKSLRAMAEAIESDLALLQPAAIGAIESELNLDKIGVSLTDVLNAMKDPDGKADDKLEAALLQGLGRVKDDDKASRPVSFDDIGRYGPV